MFRRTDNPVSGRAARRRLAAAAAALVATCFAVAPASQPRAELTQLRVCADPNNLPFSNDRGEGFENKLAEMVARDLGLELTYTWWAQRRGFIRNTLNAGTCDVIMGVPNLEMIATTRPYYRSTYVFVSRRDRALDIVSLDDPRLRTLRIGVHLIGDDGSNTPPAHALGELGIIDNVVGYTIYGDYREDSPPRALVDAVVSGDVDIAAVWGPLAGYLATRVPVELDVVPIEGTVQFLPLVFQFPIAMGVRSYDDRLKRKLDEVLMARRDEIRALLESYGIPTL